APASRRVGPCLEPSRSRRCATRPDSMARRPRRLERSPLRTWLRRGLLGLGVVLVLASGALAAGVWLSLPPAPGTLRLPGLSAPVTITLDRQGVPRIAAVTE